MNKEKKNEELEKGKQEQNSRPLAPATYSEDEEWVKQHKKEFSEDPTFF